MKKKLSEQLKSLAPRPNVHYHIGMRVVKTAAAVMVCLLIALLTGSRNSIPITAVSALVAMQATAGDTVKTSVYRVLGTVIGGAFGLLAVIIGIFVPYYIEGLFVIIIPLMLLLDLYLCNVLKMHEACSISCVVTIIVAARVTTDISVSESLVYTIIRLRDTFIGVVIATIINALPNQVAGIFKLYDDEAESETADK